MAAGVSTASAANAYVLAETTTGTPTRWTVSEVPVVIDGSVDALGLGAHDAVLAAFGTWRAVEGVDAPNVTFTTGTADPIGYRLNDVNHNTVRFVAGGYPVAGSALSVTIATFDTTGAMVDADVIINGLPGLAFAVLGSNAPPSSPMPGPNGFVTPAPYDLQNVLTHEAGHFFGMAHAVTCPNDTMFPTSAEGETKKRTLSDDDEQGLRALYPAGATAPASCSTRMIGVSTSTNWLWALGLLVAGGAMVRRRSRARLAAAPLAIVAIIGLAAASANADAPPAGAISALASDAIATVVATESHWENGVAFTDIDLDIACPRGADSCPREETRVEVVGGTIDGLTQIASGLRVPAIGEHISLPARVDGYAWPTHLAPARASRAASLLARSTEILP